MRTLFLTITLLSSMMAYAGHVPELETVEKVDINRYIGKWYEIARFDQKFQKNCTAVTANYSIKKNGNLKVVNTCRKGNPNGKLKVAKGVARVSDKVTNAKLKVQFFLRFLNIGFLSGNYWILALGENYEYAMVGDPTRKFLWILNRESEMDERVYLELVQKAETLGFDTTKLQRTVH